MTSDTAGRPGFVGRFFGSWRLALGELLIVTLGVLLALWADQAVQSRQDAALAISYLERLQADIRADISALRFSGQQERARLEITRRVDGWVTGMEPLPEPDVVMINAHYAGVTFSPTISRFTIEELKSTGDLRLITNLQLKGQIANYYKQIGLQVEQWIAWGHTGINDTYFRELAFVLDPDHRVRIGTFDPQQLQRFLRTDDHSAPTSLGDLQATAPAIGASAEDLRDMLDRARARPNFLGYLRESMYLAQLYSQLLDGVIATAQALDAAIQQELDRLR